MVPQDETPLLLLVLAAASVFAFYAFNRGLKRSKLKRRSRLVILGGSLFVILLAILVGELVPDLAAWR